METDEDSKRLLACPEEILLLVASALTGTPKSLLAFGAAARSLAALLLRGDEAAVLWDAASARELGPSAPSLARRAGGTDISGVQAYRAALRLRAAVAERVQVVEGSVTAHMAGIGVVACPCLQSLQNFGIGAQGAIRHAAGPSLEARLAALELPLAPLSSTLVEGGALAPALVAMVVTTPPPDAPWMGSLRHGHRAWQTAVSCRLHASLFAAVRDAGRTSVAMPTLGTGGAGFDVRAVCDGLACALAMDVRQHPHAPLLLRVACYEPAHCTYVQHAKAQLLELIFDESLFPYYLAN